MPRWLLAMAYDDPIPAAIAAGYAANWAVTDWYLDGTIGNDANSGTTVGAPLRTGAELMRRLGPYAIFSASVTVHLLATVADGLALRGWLPAGEHLDIVGETTIVASDTVASFVPVNHVSVPARGSQFTAAVIADFTPFRRMRARLTSGAFVGACAFIDKENPSGAGNNVARTQPWSYLNTAGVSFVTTAATPAVNDAFVIETLPIIPSLSVDLDGPLSAVGGALWAGRQFSIRSCNVPLFRRNITGDASAYRVLIWGNVFDAIYESQGKAESGKNTVDGSMLTWSGRNAGTRLDLPPRMQYCLAAGGGNYIHAVFGSGAGSQLSFCMVSDLGVYCSTFSVVVGLQIFDSPAAAGHGISVTPRSHVQVQSVSGAGLLAAVGIKVSNGATFTRLDTVWNLPGAVSDCQFQTPTVVALSVSQFFQPDDYAQHGITLAMVAGATTVTVPWYLNTGAGAQQVTVTHDAFAGTPGILSVQQISTTQFTITSSSALDTSTVRWQISPLGRNIHIL